MRVAYSKERGSRKQRICLCSSRLTGRFPETLYAFLGQFCIEKHIKQLPKVVEKAEQELVVVLAVLTVPIQRAQK